MKNNSATNQSPLRIVVMAIAALVALSQFVGRAKQPDSPSHADINKSDYIFLEALRYESGDSTDAYYEMICRAYDLNPEDLYIGYDYGLYEMLLNYPDSMSRAEHGIDLMKRYVAAVPDDYAAGLRLANFLGQMERTDEALATYKLLYENAKDPRITGSAYSSALAYTYKPDSIRKAITLIDSLERFTGSHTDYIGQKVKYYNLLSDTTSILNELRRLYQSAPRSIDYVLLMGDAFMRFGQLDSAKYYVDKAVEIDPTSGNARFGRAQYFLQVGDSAAYDAEIFDAMQYPDLDVETKTQLMHSYVAGQLADSTESDNVVELFESLIEQYPHEEDVRQLYGSYLYSVGDREGAADQFSVLVGLNPDNQQLWTSLIIIYYGLEDYEMAVATVDDALRYFPDDTQLYLMGSSSAIADEEFDIAANYLDRALTVAGDSAPPTTLAEIYGAKGDLAFKMDDGENALKFYYQALQLDSTSSNLLNNTAYYMACEGIDLERALQYVEQALKYEEFDDGSTKATTLDTYAWVLFKLKDYKRAYEVINQVLELSTDDQSVDVLEHAGDIYFMNGSPQEALEFWKEALELDPDNDLLKRKVKHKTYFFE